MPFQSIVQEGVNSAMMRRGDERLRQFIRTHPTHPRRKVTEAYTLKDGDSLIIADLTTAAFTATLPKIKAVPDGKEYTFFKLDSSSNALTIDGDGSEQINGATTKSISAQYGMVTIVSDQEANKWLTTGSNSLTDILTSVTTVTTTYTALDSDEIIIADASGGAFTVTLPAVSGVPDGKEYTVIKSDTSTNLVTIDGNGSETINDDTTKAIGNRYGSITMKADVTGGKWLMTGTTSSAHTLYPRRSVTSTGNILASDYAVIADATAAAITLTLPALSTVPDGKKFHIKRVDNVNLVTVEGSGGTERIDASTSQALPSQHDSITIIADKEVSPDQWWVI